MVLVNEELTYLDVRIAPAAVELPGLTVSARSRVPFLEDSGFYQRERRGLGTFLSPREVAALPAVETSDLLKRIAGITVSAGRVRSMRSPGMASCALRLIVDGVRYNGSLNSLPLQVVDAVEVYKGPATTPIQWRDVSGCGAIVIWTKR